MIYSMLIWLEEISSQDKEADLSDVFEMYSVYRASYEEVMPMFKK